MNKKAIYIMTVLMSFFCMSALAQDNTATLSVEKFTIAAGETKDVNVIFNSTKDMTSLSVDITMPEGFTCVKAYDDDEEDDIYATIANSDIATKKHSITSAIRTNGDLGVRMIHMSNKAFATQNGIAFTFHVKAPANIAPGTYPIKLHSIEIVETDGATAHHPSDYTYTIEKTSAPTELGKVNMIIDFKVGNPYCEQQKDIPAAGGKDRAVSEVEYNVVTRTFLSDGTYTDSDKSALMTSYIYGDYTTEVPSLGTIATERTKVGTSVAKGKIYDSNKEAYKAETTDFSKLSDFEATAATLDLYQEANIATYADVTISTVGEMTLSIEGDSYDLSNSTTASQNVTYTSGQSAEGQIAFSYEVKTPVDGYSLIDSYVVVEQNSTSAPRDGFVVTATATGEGGKSASADITFYQPISTAISSLKALLTNAKIYDLNGCVVNSTIDNLPKGIYIINNRKYIVK